MSKQRKSFHYWKLFKTRAIHLTYIYIYGLGPGPGEEEEENGCQKDAFEIEKILFSFEESNSY